MNSNSFVSPSILISDIASMVGDDEFRFRSKGFYIGQIQSCLNELAFDTFFQELTIDLDMPEDGFCLPMPENIFNIRQVFVFNGDECEISESHIVYHKRNYVGRQSGYTARSKDATNSDPYQLSGGSNERTNYFYEVQNGLIMLSESCTSFEKIRLYCNGTGGAIADAPIVPLFFRQAVIDWVSSRVMAMMMAKGAGDVKMLSFLKKDTDLRLNDPYEGSWIKAQRRVANIDSKEKEDLQIYLGRMNY